MRGLSLEHLVADLALRILDQQPALRPLHEHNERDDGDRHQITTRMMPVDSAP